MPKSNHCRDCAGHAPANEQKFPREELKKQRTLGEVLRRERQQARKTPKVEVVDKTGEGKTSN